MRMYKQSPNESPGVIHPMAVKVLEQWEGEAFNWPRYPDGRCVRCGKCDQSIYMSRDIHGVLYNISQEEILSLTVAHLRQRHPEVIDGNE